MTDKELVRQLRTNPKYKSAIQIAVEDSGLADRVIILGQGDYPNFAGLADMITALQNQAADRIEALSAENKRLREALEETVSDLTVLSGNVFDAEKRDSNWNGMYERVRSWIQRARAALGGE